MKKSLSQMNNIELRQYLSENRNDEEKFTQALELLMNRKKNNLKYPPPEGVTSKLKALLSKAFSNLG